MKKFFSQSLNPFRVTPSNEKEFLFPRHFWFPSVHSKIQGLSQVSNKMQLPGNQVAWDLILLRGSEATYGRAGLNQNSFCVFGHFMSGVLLHTMAEWLISFWVSILDYDLSWGLYRKTKQQKQTDKPGHNLKPTLKRGHPNLNTATHTNKLYLWWAHHQKGNDRIS